MNKIWKYLKYPSWVLAGLGCLLWAIVVACAFLIGAILLAIVSIVLDIID
jgi:hypothetical protein